MEIVLLCLFGNDSSLPRGQDSKGVSTPVKSSDIEEKFQRNPTSSFTFNVNGETLELKFKGEVNSLICKFVTPFQLNSSFFLTVISLFLISVCLLRNATGE